MDNLIIQNLHPTTRFKNGHLINADCFDAMKSIDSKSIQLICADLPFGTTNNSWDTPIPFNDLWAEYNRILSPNAYIILFAQGIFTAQTILSNRQYFKHKTVWIKSKATNFLNSKKQPLRKHEDLIIFKYGKPKYNPQFTESHAYDKGTRKNQQTGSYNQFEPAHIKSDGKRYPTDVLFYDYEQEDYDDCVYFKTAESEGDVLHPTQKPLALMDYIIRTYSGENDCVLDNVMGVGSTCISANRLNRKFIGIEKSFDYYNLSIERFNKNKII